MNIKQLTINSDVDKLIITDTSILHLILDLDVKLEDVIYHLGLNLSNCESIVCSKGFYKIGNLNYNLTKRYNLLKVELQKTEDRIKKLNVVLNIKEIPERKFVIFDHFDITIFLKYYMDKMNPKKLMENLIIHLKDLHTKYKRKYPLSEHSLLFVTDSKKFISKDNLEIPTIFNLLYYLPSMQKEIDKNIFVDKKVLYGIADETHPHIMPIIINNDNNILISKSNIQKIYKHLDDLKNITNPVITGQDNPIANEIVSKIKTDENKLIIDPNKLQNLSKYIDTNNKIILHNIETHINDYLASKSLDSSKEINKDDLTELVLKSINFSIHGTDKLKKEYIDKPELLISKLYSSEYYTKQINPIVTIENYLFEPKDIITLKEVSTPVRKEFEFSENINNNIKKLFNSLSTNTEYPIKILDFNYEYDLDNINRTVTYTITVQNTNGGYDKPYELKIKIPKLVNNKYFKLKGNNYIMSNQMFLEPITKTSPNECRFLSNYSMITLEVVNFKFDFSDISKMVDYVNAKYSNIINHIHKNKKEELLSVEFNDSKQTSINIYDDDNVISTNEYHLRHNKDEGLYELVYSNGETEPLKSGKNEFLQNELSRILKEVNPKDTFITTMKSIPYLRIHIQGIQLPLILYLAQQIGLLNVLVKLEIEYSIGELREDLTSKSTVSFKLSNDKFLYIYCKNTRDELIVNGLLNIKTSVNENDINSRNSFDAYITNKYGSRTIYNFDMSAMYHIDTITKELLEYQHLPTNVVDIVSGVMIDKLLNDKVDDINDLNIHRCRQSEIISNLLYKELRQAHSRYIQNVLGGQADSKLFVAEDWIINSLLGANPSSKGNSVLNYTSTFNPVAELKEDSKIIKSGPGGIPNKISYKAKHRDIHSSHYGNIGANDTSEGPDIGINIKHTLNVLINTKYGFYQNKDIKNINGWETVSIGEALTPFVNSMESGRMILAATHAGQIVPIKKPDIPIVSTGANFIIPQITSNKFCITAEDDGEIINSIPNKLIEVKYKDGTKKCYDTSLRITATKRSTYLGQELTNLPIGSKFKKAQLLAWSGLFDGEGYTHGKNLTMAIMNYIGFSHEDGYVVSENIIDDYSSTYLKEIPVIIPENVNIIKFINKLNTNTEPNDVLIEFGFNKNIDEYLDIFNIIETSKDEFDNIDADNEELYMSTGNSIQIKSPGGIIKDIKIYLNQRKGIDPVLLKFHNSLSSNIKDTVKQLTKYNKSNFESANALDNIDTTQLKIGKHKHKNIIYDGAKIIYYIESNRQLNVGDKVSNRYGAKGIVSKIIPKDLTPKTNYSGNVDIFLSASGLLGRKNLAVLKEIYIGKILLNMNKELSKKIEFKESISNIKKIILDVYKQLDTTKDQRIVKSIQKKLTNIKDIELKKQILENKFKFIIIYEPFENITFNRIRQAAQMLNIPLEEKVFIPELNTWSKTSVPVGCQYIQLMEQFGKDYHSARSTGKYTMLTGQPVKGKKNIGGQTVGPLDVYALLNYDSKNMLKELLTIKSDDFYNKRRIYSQILETGQSVDMPTNLGKGKSADLKDIFILGLGLYIS